MQTASETLSTPRTDHREGQVARSIEQQTAKLPSEPFVGRFGIHWDIAGFQGRGQGPCSKLYWAVGADFSNPWDVQQVGKAARFRRSLSSPRQGVFRLTSFGTPDTKSWYAHPRPAYATQSPFRICGRVRHFGGTPRAVLPVRSLR